MCELTTILAVASVASTVLGGVQQASAQRDAGRAQAQQAQYQAQVAANNQIIAQRNMEAAERAAQAVEGQAAEAKDRGAQMAKNQADATKRLMGRQRAVLAANGVLVDAGSAVDIGAETAELGKIEELTIRNNAAREAIGFQQQAQNFRTDAANFGTEGQNFATEQAASNAKASYAVKAGNAAASGTILSTFGNVAQKWYGFKKEGVF